MDLMNITIFDWLKNSAELELKSDISYITIISDRDLEHSSDYKTLTSRDKELLVADLYMRLYLYPSQVTESINDQGYSNSASIQTRGHEEFYDYAMAVYEQYDLVKYEKYTAFKSRIEKFDVIKGWV